MARNVVNQEALTEYLADFMDCIYEGEEYGYIEDTTKCQKWINTVARNHILANFPTEPYMKSRFEAPWIQAARTRGDDLVMVMFGSCDFDDQLCRIAYYIERSGISDVARLSWGDAIKQQIAWMAAEVERIAKEEAKWAAVGGAVPVCTFSDGKQVVELKTEAAVEDEARRQRNCLSSYTERVRQGRYRVLSVRDETGKSLISIGIHIDGTVDDIKETCNRQVQKSNQVYVKQVLQRIGVKNTRHFKWAKVAVASVQKTETVGLYERGNTKLTSLKPGEYKGNVDISHTKVKSLPENSTFHGHVYAQGIDLVIPKSTVVKGKVYS